MQIGLFLPFAGKSKGYYNSFTDSQFPNFSLPHTCEVAVVCNACEAESFSLLIFNNEKHCFGSVLPDALREPALYRRQHLVSIAPGRYPDNQARRKAQHKRLIGRIIGSNAN